jgi:hypothetical protein
MLGPTQGENIVPLNIINNVVAAMTCLEAANLPSSQIAT